ncbi:MAG: molybdopterin-dependent oxidoreductase [Chloroflexi bacterium]|nr:molybdopterin-dependent oxidoreductase [Chloroflexota bacterium]
MRILDELPKFPTRGAPAFNPTQWRLVVDGLVATPVQMTYDEVLRLPYTAMKSDFECVDGWRVPGLGWEGFSLRAIVDMAQPLPQATFVAFHSGTYRISLPLEEALAPGVMLAHHLHGSPLPYEYGAPLRLVTDGKECFYGVKWVQRLEFSDSDAGDTAKDIALGRIQARLARQGS